jgi:hypothetical protein
VGRFRQVDRNYRIRVLSCLWRGLPKINTHRSDKPSMRLHVIVERLFARSLMPQSVDNSNCTIRDMVGGDQPNFGDGCNCCSHCYAKGIRGRSLEGASFSRLHVRI